MPQRSFITEEDKNYKFYTLRSTPSRTKRRKKHEWVGGTTAIQVKSVHHYYASIGLVAKSCLKFLFTTIPSPTPCLHFPIYTTNHRYLQSFP